ncbi:MAG: DJ-1/PfpI family protein [Spirochaetes bacterium]|nr:DJ-1/PfpI family protein [Spirochaetota bacterium]
MKVLVPLASGFEEIEAITIVDILRRASIDVTTASLEEGPVTGSHGISVIPDTGLTGLDISGFSLIVLPGGMPGSANLKANDRILEAVRRIHDAGGSVAAICAAPIVLAAAGVLRGKRATCYPGYEKELTGATAVDEPVTVDGRIITGRGAGCAIPFALRLVEIIKGSQAALDLKQALQVYWM